MLSNGIKWSEVDALNEQVKKSKAKSSIKTSLNWIELKFCKYLKWKKI